MSKNNDKNDDNKKKRKANKPQKIIYESFEAQRKSFEEFVKSRIIHRAKSHRGLNRIEFTDDEIMVESPGSFIKSFRPYLHMFGAETALFLQYLIERRNFYRLRKWLVRGWFFSTTTVVIKELGRTYTWAVQQKCIKILKSWGILRTTVRHSPDSKGKMGPRRYFKLDAIHLKFLFSWIEDNYLRKELPPDERPE